MKNVFKGDKSIRTDEARREAKEKLTKHQRHDRWRRAVSVLASVMVFVTTYAMILPTITATRVDLPDDFPVTEEAEPVNFTVNQPQLGDIVAIQDAYFAALAAAPLAEATMAETEVAADAVALVEAGAVKEAHDAIAEASAMEATVEAAPAEETAATAIMERPLADSIVMADAAQHYGLVVRADDVEEADKADEATLTVAVLDKDGQPHYIEIQAEDENLTVLREAEQVEEEELSILETEVQAILDTVALEDHLDEDQALILRAQAAHTLAVLAGEITEEESDVTDDAAAEANAEDASADDAAADAIEDEANIDDVDSEVAEPVDGEAIDGTDGEDAVDDEASADADIDANTAVDDNTDIANTQDDVTNLAKDTDKEDTVNDNQDAADQQNGAPSAGEAEKQPAEALPLKLAKKVDGITVTAEFGRDVFPAGVQMLVHPEDSDAYAEQVADATGRTRCELKPLDIQFVVGGQEIEPDGIVQITFEADFLTEEAQPEVVHVTDDGSAEAIASNLEDGQLTLTTDSFSVYVIAYTVDFEYEGFAYSIQGGSAITLSALFEALGIERSVQDVESVEFSDPTLVWIGQAEEETTIGALKEAHELACDYSADMSEETLAEIDAQTVAAGDWALISLQAFDTEESLTVTMKDGEVVMIRVTDAQISKDDVRDEVGYIIFTVKDGLYYVLKADGTAQRFDNADGFDDLSNEYKWTITHVYTEDEQERYNIHSYSNPSKSLALNAPGRNLLATGANNIIVEVSDDGYTFTGYNNTKLALVDNSGNISFAGVDGNASTMYIYEQNALDIFKFEVSTSDFGRGVVSGINNVDVSEDQVAQYTAGTTSDKKNKQTIKAIPQSDKYIFDHWELNGAEITAGSTINPGELTIPYNGSRLEAIFKVNPDYAASDAEKEGKGFDDTSKKALEDWLKELNSRQVPLDQNGCDKTAEVYDYDNRIYRVDLTAKSSLTTFDGTIDLGFIMDVSGSMEFPSKLTPVEGKADYDINQINNGHQNDFDNDEYYYLIADKAGTATVYRLFYGTYQENTWYGTINRTGWWAVDSSYKNDDRRHFFIGNNSKFSNDTSNMKYQIYTDGDNGNLRKNYLMNSVNGTVTELNNILKTLSLADSETQNPDVKIAYNTFFSQVNEKQHVFVSAKVFDTSSIKWATGGGTATDKAIEDAKDFDWGKTKATKNYAILITDGAPQADGKAIANQKVIDKANDLKKGSDNKLGTDDDVKLITIGLSMGDVKRGSVLLYDLADRDSDNEKMFFKAESGDELQYALYEILQKIMVDATVQGNVTDTVGDAFYPIDLITGEQLVAGDVVDLSGNRIAKSVDNLTDEQKKDGFGVLQSDGKTIDWNNQNFTTDGWHGTVYVKAKEDLLGGNAVRTNNGNASIEAVSYQTPSMEYPATLRERTATDENYILKVDNLESPLVNVNELSFVENKTEWNVYLGTEVDPGKQLEALWKEILVEEKVTAGQDLEPEVKDNLIDHVEGGLDNYLYPVKQSISDKRESEIEDGKTPVTFPMNDLLKKLVKDKGYSWWDYDKGEPKYKEFFEAASTDDGITLDYDVYGLNEKMHKLDNNTQKTDGSTINIKLTKVIEPGEIDAGVDPLNGTHVTKVIGDAVEKYTLTVLYSPDYEILPEGQGGKSLEDFHVGSYGTLYQGHAVGTETSTNVHTINVYTKPLEVKKTDPDGNTLPGAKFGIYRPAKPGETGVSLSSYNSTLSANYVLVSEGTSDGNGIVRLADTGNTEATRLVPGIDYILIETEAPADFERDDSVRHVAVTVENGSYTDLKNRIITEEVEGTEGEKIIQARTNLSDYDEPFNWNQGVRISVDGVVIVAPDSSASSGAGSVAVGTATEGEPSETATDERELGASEYVRKTNPLLFRTTIINSTNTVTLDVTKKWVDDKGVNKSEVGYSITFNVTKKAGVNETAKSVNLEGHITTKDGVKVNDDNSTVTLTYQAGSGWPTARIIGLEKYDSSSENEWIYEVTETICNPSGKVDPANAKYEIKDNNGIKTVTIVNVEKNKIQIGVDKKWFGADGQELAQAPENSITFEVYRVAHIPCVHDYANQDWVVENEPTCTDNGSKYRECSKCGEKEYATIPANGHSWSEWSVRKPATYAEDGEEVRICSVCGTEETRPITKLPHEHVYDELEYVNKPTCTEPGEAHEKCSLCGDVKEATIVVPALGHNWDDGKVTQAATCTEKGVKTYTCTRNCGETKTEEIAALGHDWVYEDDPAATCLTQGTRKWTCRNDSSHHDAEHPETETIAALDHLWGPWETQEEATATTDGINIRYCLRDHDHFEKMTVPKTGETYKLNDGTDTGLEVSPYDWPTQVPPDKDLNDNTTVKAINGIIKCVNNNVTSYYVIYGSRDVNYNQLLSGPDDAVFNDILIKLTGTIKTRSDVKDGQLTVQKGDLYLTEDGHYYTCKSVGGMVNVDRNDPDNSVKNDKGNWVHIQKATVSADDNGTNGIDSAPLRSASKVAKVKKVFTSLNLLKAPEADNKVSDGQDTSATSGTGSTDADRKARIAALMNTTADNILFRSELGDQSNVDAWEYVTQYTGSGTNWAWTLNDLDAYDDDGNEYLYYVVETSPKDGYTVTYVGQESGLNNGKNVTIKNELNTTKITVNKVWADSGTFDHSSDTVTYKIYQIPYTVSGEDTITYDPIEYRTGRVLDSKNDWTATEDNLPLAGMLQGENNTTIPVFYKYYAVEDPVDGYKAETAETSDGYTFTNTPLSPVDRRTELNVKKIWKDAAGKANPDAHKNDSITFKVVQTKYKAVHSKSSLPIYPVEIHFVDSDNNESVEPEQYYIPQGRDFRVTVSGTNAFTGTGWKIIDSSKKTLYSNTVVSHQYLTVKLTGKNAKWSSTNIKHEITSINSDTIIRESDLLSVLNKGTPIKTDSYEYNLSLDTDGKSVLTRLQDAIGNVAGTDPWKGTISDLPFFEEETDETGKKAFYIYTYEVSEVKITRNGTQVEMVNPTDGKTGEGDSNSFHVTWAGQDKDWTITNQEKPTVDFDIIKVEKGNTTKTLPGASFTIQKIMENSSTGSVQTDGTAKASDPAITGDDGKTSFKKIESGIYEIKETKTPDGGYVITGDDAFYIKVEGTTVKLLEKEIQEGTLSFKETSSTKVGNVTLGVGADRTTIQFTVENERGIALPSTGGPGTIPFAAGGAVLTGTAGVLLIRRKRRGARVH